MSIPSEQFYNKDKAFKLYRNKAKFNMLDADKQGILLSQHVDIMKEALKNSKELAALSDYAVSKAVSSYVMNVAEYGKRNKDIFWLSDNPATVEEREAICFEVAKRPEIVNKLNPAARILFFSFLKKSIIYQSISDNPDNKEKNDVKRLELTHEMINTIENAYDIQTDYTVLDDAGRHNWNKCLWPSMAGGFGIGCALTRMIELWRITQTGEDNYRPCSVDEIYATAEVLITHPSFNNAKNCYGFAQIFTNHTVKEQQQKKYDPDRWISCPFRYALGMQYKHCAGLMIEHPEYRGREIGEITDRDLDAMAKKHGLKSLLAKVRQKERDSENQGRLENECKLKAEALAGIEAELRAARAQIEAEQKKLTECMAALEAEKQQLLSTQLTRQSMENEIRSMQDAKQKAEREAQEKAEREAKQKADEQAANLRAELEQKLNAERENAKMREISESLSARAETQYVGEAQLAFASLEAELSQYNIPSLIFSGVSNAKALSAGPGQVKEKNVYNQGAWKGV